MKLEVGKKYLRRDGEVEEIVGYDGDLDWPYIGKSYENYTEGGFWLDGSEDPRDLIAEYVEQTELEYEEQNHDILTIAASGINPKDAEGAKKQRLTNLPTGPLYAIAAAFDDGGKKYGPYNFRESKVNAMVYVEALRSHLDHFKEGEDFASDSGIHHMAHAAANAIIILDAIQQGTLHDDRPPSNVSLENILNRLVRK